MHIEHETVRSALLRFGVWSTAQSSLVFLLRALTLLVAYWNGGLVSALVTAALIVVWAWLADAVTGPMVGDIRLLPQLVLLILYFPVVQAYWVVRFAEAKGSFWNTFTLAAVVLEVLQRLCAHRAALALCESSTSESDGLYPRAT